MSGFITEPTSATPTGPAGGDLTGTYPNPTVDGLQGRAVASTAPSSSQVLTWNGSAWAPANAATPLVLWKWNQTDTSQFRIALDEVGGGTCALSVVTNTYGPALRATFPTKVDGLKATVITISDLAIAKNSASQYRYTIRFRCVTPPSSLVQWYSVGPAFLCNASTSTSFYGLACTSALGGASRLVKLQAGVSSFSGGTPNWVTTGGSAGLGGGASRVSEFMYGVVAKQSASAPSFLNMGVGNAWAQSSSTIEGQNDACYANQCGAFSVGWNSQTLDTCGICIVGTTGTTGNQFIEFDSIEILRDPMDLGT